MDFIRLALRITCGLVALVVLAACGPQSTELSPRRSEAAEPQTSRPAQPEVQFEVLAVSTSSPEMGVIRHATTTEELDDLWRRYQFDDDPVAVDFEQYVVLVYARAEDACPDEIVGFALDNERLDARWQPPPGGCNEPLIPTATAVAVDRATVPTSFVAVMEGFAQEYPQVKHRVELEGAPAQPAAVATDRPEAPPPETVHGTVALPAPGQAEAARLDDGTRVWVVHHHDSAVSVLAADAVAKQENIRDLRTQVGWSPTHRRFLGDGWFDEYGVSLAGRAAKNLDWYASAVRNDEVVVGERVGPVPFATPTGSRGAGDDAQDLVFPDHPARTSDAVTVAEALSGPDGSVAVIDASLVAYATRPLQICKAPDTPELWDWSGCPETAPVPTGVGPHTGGDNMMNVWFGPLRVRVEGRTLTDVTTLGGGVAGGIID